MSKCLHRLVHTVTTVPYELLIYKFASSFGHTETEWHL